MSQSFKYVPPHVLGFEGEHVAVVTFGLVGVSLLLVPFIDRAKAPRAVARACTVGGILMLVFMAVMSFLAYVKPY